MTRVGLFRVWGFLFRAACDMRPYSLTFGNTCCMCASLIYRKHAAVSQNGQGRTARPCVGLIRGTRSFGYTTKGACM